MVEIKNVETIELDGKEVRRTKKEHDKEPDNCEHKHRGYETCRDCGIVIKDLGVCDLCGKEVGKEDLAMFKGVARCPECYKKTVTENKSLVPIEKAFKDL